MSSLDPLNLLSASNSLNLDLNNNRRMSSDGGSDTYTPKCVLVTGQPFFFFLEKQNEDRGGRKKSLRTPHELPRTRKTGKKTEKRWRRLYRLARRLPPRPPLPYHARHCPRQARLLRVPAKPRIRRERAQLQVRQGRHLLGRPRFLPLGDREDRHRDAFRGADARGQLVRELAGVHAEQHLWYERGRERERWLSWREVGKVRNEGKRTHFRFFFQNQSN